MRVSRSIHRFIVFLICAVILSPSSILAGRFSARPEKGRSLRDIQLQPSGELLGQIVDPQGVPIPDEAVVIFRNGKVIAQGKTDNAGIFSTNGASTGVLQIVAGDSARTFRVWSAKAAPPAAVDSILLVQGTTVRGQHAYGCPPGYRHGQRGFGSTMFGGAASKVLSNPWIVGGLVAAAIAIPIATLNDDEDAS